MQKHEWMYPVVMLLVLAGAMSIVSVGITSQQYNPSTKTFQLRNH